MQSILTSHIEKIQSHQGNIEDLENDIANSIAMEAISFCNLGMHEIAEDTKERITEIIRKIAVELCIPYDQVIKKLIPEKIGVEKIGYLKTGEYYQSLSKTKFFQKYVLNSSMPDLLELGRDVINQGLIYPNAEKILSTQNWLNPEYDADAKKSPEEMMNHLFSDKLWHRLILFLVVGHETSANPIKFALMILADPQHANILKKLREELRVNPPETWNEDNFPDTPYLQAVINETLRLYPPLPNLFYEGVEDLEFSGGTIDAGDLVVISPECTHVYQTEAEKQDPTHWKRNPKEFNPERFLEINADGHVGLKYLPDFEFFPFGFNPRKCLGQFFARQEAKIALARLVTQFDLTCSIKDANNELKPLTGPYPYDQIFTLHLHLKKVHMQFTPRNNLEEKQDERSVFSLR